MSMDAVLKRLESRIEELVAAYEGARGRVGELEQRVGELEARLEEAGDAGARIGELEDQREALGQRLEQVLQTIDAALAEQGDGGGEAEG